MKDMKMQIAVSLAAVMLAVGAGPTFATVLTFDKSPTQFAFPDPFFGTPSASVYSDYGDNVTAADLVSGQDVSATHGAGVKFHYGSLGGATPDITVSYLGPVTDSVLANSGMKAYQDANFPLGLLTHLADPVPRRLFTFTSTHATDILSLRSFTIHSGGLVHSVDDLRVVRINADSSETVLYTTGPTSTGPGPLTFDFNAAPLEGKVLAIDFDPTSQHNSFVWDNITFVQEIPEPSAVAIACATVTGVLLRRRRRAAE